MSLPRFPGSLSGSWSSYEERRVDCSKPHSSLSVSRRAVVLGASGAILGLAVNTPLMPILAAQDAEQPIRVGMTGDGSTLDPANWTNTNERHFIPAMFDNLVAVDEELNLIPALATEWTTSDDGLVWTFT